MYHRYQPTENGQLHRQSVPDAPPPPREVPKKPNKPMPAPKPAIRIPFLEKLLPNMDTGDLLVLLILLLLLSEGNEDSSSVVMTLAIFLFLQ